MTWHPGLPACLPACLPARLPLRCAPSSASASAGCRLPSEVRSPALRSRQQLLAAAAWLPGAPRRQQPCHWLCPALAELRWHLRAGQGQWQGGLRCQAAQRMAGPWQWQRPAWASASCTPAPPGPAGASAAQAAARDGLHQPRHPGAAPGAAPAAAAPERSASPLPLAAGPWSWPLPSPLNACITAEAPRRSARPLRLPLPPPSEALERPGGGGGGGGGGCPGPPPEQRRTLAARCAARRPRCWRSCSRASWAQRRAERAARTAALAAA
jgi:hypothetical protein